MNRTIDILENVGLIDIETVQEQLEKLPEDRVYALVNELEESIKPELDITQDGTTLPFNFVASASLRGDSGCSSLRCHKRKTQMVARYAGLFCDSVVLPLRVYPPHKDPDIKDHQRYLLTFVLSVLELRPLIESGIITLVPSKLDFCPFCHPEIVPAAPSIFEAAQQLETRHFSQFGLSKVTRHGIVGLRLDGPEEYIEHGTTWYYPVKDAAGLPDGPLSEQELRKRGLVDAIFKQIANDVVLEEIYGVRFNARYLTDRPGEAELLSALNAQDQLAARTASLCANLAHRVPLLSEIPLERIVRIRREDYTAFENYRVTLQKIIKDYVATKHVIGDNEAKELYADILEPEILKMEVQAQSERNAALKKSAVKIGSTFLAVGLGVYGGLVPHQWAEIFKAVGGFALVKEVAETLASMPGTATVRNHNLFFLLRLKQENAD